MTTTTSMMKAVNKFQVGDRVVRRENVFDEKSRLMKGVVVNVYAYQSEHHGFYPEVYAVRWNHRNEYCCGYLPHGISQEITQDMPAIKVEGEDDA